MTIDLNNLLPYIITSIVAVILLAFIARQLWRKLRENETLKYEFITIIAHKFRTPLTQTKWLTENLISAETDPFKKENLANMQKANQGLIDLTARLIEITDSDPSSVASFQFERIEVYPLLKNIGYSLQSSFQEKNIFFAIKPPVDPVFINADKARMEFVFQTLLSNASTYTPPGRNVDVTIALLPKGKKVSISVTDHGIGIDPKDLPHLFTKFYRAENARRTDTEGFGVGLYLARSVIRRHKGKIEAHSEGLGKGATFEVVLPVVK